MSSHNGFSRRTFLAGSAAATAVSLSATHVYGQKSSAEFRFAKVGCGGMGGGDLNSVVASGGKLVAMCDVDDAKAKGSYDKYPDVPKFKDYRVMLEKMDKEIDGVVISTPDHTHTVVALDAMKRGKHVYVQKPLARTFEECRLMLEASRKYKVVTQMGNQGHAGPGLILWKKMMDAKAFGDIKEVHSWSNRPIWPQGMTEMPKPETIPDTMDWDLWLGPAKTRPYSSVYAPFKWRGWWDFGCGAMGDMACHNMDPAFWILQWGLPTSIKAQASAPAVIAYPKWSIIEYTFPASPVCPEGIKMTWYDGKKLPAKPQGCHPQLDVGGNGCMIVGSEMTAMGGSHASPPRPIALGGKEFGPEVKEAERFWRDELKKTKGCNHYKQWVDACKANDRTMPGSNFEYSVPMTQAIILGCLALRFPGEELKWDAKKACFSNHDEANKWLSFQPRAGFILKA
ncbi:MAG: Gfo/Idh/MocA family oxidoreductase [Kiritimatiellae bacterium]|jgi:predicted dehydrogenase|nr:Gfo/Idh/MocA family oxidoreductase [Kiritimatiellia bacterium]